MGFVFLTGYSIVGSMRFYIWDLLHSIHITDEDVKMYFLSTDLVAWQIKALCQEGDKKKQKTRSKKKKKRKETKFSWISFFNNFK